MKPLVRMMTLRNRVKKPTVHKMPKLITIGDSVGIVISKLMLNSIGWKKGDYISMEYNDEEDELRITNYTSNERRHR